MSCLPPGPISTRQTCKSSLSVTASKSNRKLLCLANWKFTMPRANCAAKLQFSCVIAFSKSLWHHQTAMHTRLAFLCVPLLLAFASCCALPLTANKKPPLHPINLNTATALELQQVPGIGPSTADKILKMRRSSGAFKSVDDLRAIKGIGPKRMEKMRKYLTVGKPAAPKTRTSTPPRGAGANPPAAHPPP